MIGNDRFHSQRLPHLDLPRIGLVLTTSRRHSPDHSDFEHSVPSLKHWGGYVVLLVKLKLLAFMEFSSNEFFRTYFLKKSEYSHLAHAEGGPQEVDEWKLKEYTQWIQNLSILDASVSIQRVQERKAYQNYFPSLQIASWPCIPLKFKNI